MSFLFSVVIGDLFGVKDELRPVVARWKYIGLALGLDYNKLHEIEENSKNCEECLDKSLALWLNKVYDTKRWGQPSWTKLVEAVQHTSGGNNPSLAEMIAKKHRVDYIHSSS